MSWFGKTEEPDWKKAGYKSKEEGDMYRKLLENVSDYVEKKKTDYYIRKQHDEDLANMIE